MGKTARTVFESRFKEIKLPGREREDQTSRRGIRGQKVMKTVVDESYERGHAEASTSDGELRDAGLNKSIYGPPRLKIASKEGLLQRPMAIQMQEAETSGKRSLFSLGNKKVGHVRGGRRRREESVGCGHVGKYQLSMHGNQWCGREKVDNCSIPEGGGAPGWRTGEILTEEADRDTSPKKEERGRVNQRINSVEI